jgi:hypothetical protein
MRGAGWRLFRLARRCIHYPPPTLPRAQDKWSAALSTGSLLLSLMSL